MSELFVIGALLIFTNLFWSFIVVALVNRLMSRNYFEFKEASLRAEKKPGKLESSGTQELQAIDDTQFGSVSEIIQ